MPIENIYNTNPTTVDSLLRQRQTRVDLAREEGTIPKEQPVEAPKLPKFLGVEQTKDFEGKSFGRKVLEDAALLSYAIPVGLANIVTHPIEFIKEIPGAIKQSVQDLVDPDYYKAHPLLGAINFVSFAAPIAGLVKSTTLKVATKTALNAGIKEAVALGVEETAVKTALNFGAKTVGGVTVKKGVFANTIVQVAKTGKVEIVSEVVKGLLTKSGVADDVALRVANEVSNNVYRTLSRQTTKMKVMEAIAHPLDASMRFVGKKTDSIRKAVFGGSEKAAVTKLYGAETVAKNPEGFIEIERWADAQLKEQGLESSLANRQRVMQAWTDQNSQWASLTPEERILHFRNYAKSDLTRLAIHKATGIDIVTVKALPQNYVEAMVQTIKEAPKNLNMAQIMELMKDTYGRDFVNYTAEINKVLLKGGRALEKSSRKQLISVVSRLGDARSTISFAKFSPAVKVLAKELEKTGYRIGHAPTKKAVSFAVDILEDKINVVPAEVAKSGAIPVSNALVKKTAFGNWIEKLGLSPNGIIEGAAEFQYREGFTQGLLGKFAKKYGNIIKAKSIRASGQVSIPVEKLFEWLDKNKAVIRGVREKYSLPVRTVFDLKEADLIRAGFTSEIAKDIVGISKKALSDIPASVTGMGDKVINFLRTRNKRYNAWSNVYDGYLKAAYKGRYDLSPFFSAQEFVETKLNSALFLKDPSLLAGAGTLKKLGNWTISKLAKIVGSKKTYLRKIIDKPPLREVVAVRDEILGTLQKTMLDYTSSPDIIAIQSTAKGVTGLASEAAFEQSIKSRNLWYAITGQSSVRMATTFNKALANKFGMTLDAALDFVMEKGVKKYKNPQMIQIMREATQEVFHYKPGFLTSPLVKTMNIIWFPFRFEAKTIKLVSQWASSLSPASRLTVMNNWVHFANWAGTDEGIEWRRTNRNLLYNIFSYVTAYEQMGQGLEAVAKGRLFGGNTGLIGGVPFGFVVNLARELAVLPEDPDQFDPKTGRRFTKQIPRKLLSAASFANALEQFVISLSPSTPFYSLTGGVIGGVSPRKIYESLIRQVVGAIKGGIEGRDPARGRQMLERDFKRVPLDYSRFIQ